MAFNAGTDKSGVPINTIRMCISHSFQNCLRQLSLAQNTPRFIFYSSVINPEIIEQDGEQTGYEGCLSVPGKTGVVTRPNHVVVRALDENMDEIEVEGEGLLARAICHECAHLDGQLYTELVEGELMDTETESEETITEE